MPEPAAATSEKSVDLSNYVPKDDHTKAVTERDSLKKALDDVSSKLTSSEYIEYLESKQKGKEKANDAAKEALTPEVRTLIDSLTTRLTNHEEVIFELLADREVALVEKTNPDFSDFREDVAKILDEAAKSKENLSVAKALEIARGRKAVGKKDEKAKEPKEQSKGSEKPSSSVPASASSGGSKDYKSATEAGNAAWETVKAKYGLTSDTI